MKFRQKLKFNWRLIPGIIVGLGIIVAIYFLMPPGRNSPVNGSLSEGFGAGQSLYETNCASCHGSQGQGHIEPNAPALDDSEHAWHHPDEQIILIIKNGGFNMPPVGADMSEEEIETIIAYMKQWWTIEQKDFQPGIIGEN